MPEFCTFLTDELGKSPHWQQRSDNPPPNAGTRRLKELYAIPAGGQRDAKREEIKGLWDKWQQTVIQRQRNDALRTKPVPVPHNNDIDVAPPPPELVERFKKVKTIVPPTRKRAIDNTRFNLIRHELTRLGWGSELPYLWVEKTGCITYDNLNQTALNDYLNYLQSLPAHTLFPGLIPPSSPQTPSGPSIMGKLMEAFRSGFTLADDPYWKYGF